MKNDYRIGELAEKTGVTKRTIHYYVNRGLIPNPIGSGVKSFYTDEHLVKILLIKKLQEQFLPLEIIRGKVSGISLREAEQLLNLLTSDQLSKEQQSIVFSTEAAKKSEQLSGSEYTRFALGLGLELHVPKELLEKKEGVINSIVKYTKKLLEEQ